MNIALVGPPNSGKTTLFNWLTGARFRAVNYPGATVDYFRGTVHPRYGHQFGVVDTPGVYSFHSKSPDERVTHQLLFAEDHQLSVDAVVVVLDATQLARQLLLLEQVKSTGYPCILALTMVDLIRSEDEQLSLDQLSKELGIDIVPIDGQLGGGVRELVAMANKLTGEESKALAITSPIDHDVNEIKKLHEKMKSLVDSCTVVSNSDGRVPRRYMERTNELDRWLMHPQLGIMLFVAVMFLLFSSIFWVAQPFMDWVDMGFARLAEFIIDRAPQKLWSDFLANGIVASFGAVLIFVPQIFILFFGISFLEDSGYLARAATLVDRPLSKLGLSGRSFVPLLSGYACAVPAMMAARNIRSAKERWIAIFIIPLMSCSARLPVYALLLLFLFQGDAAWKPGLSLTAIYFGSLVFGAGAAALLDRLVQLKSDHWFMIELPIYRRPKIGVVARTAVSRTKSYIKRAGPVIFTLAVLIWVGTTFPSQENANPAKQLQHSYLGQIGQAVEPVFKPLGVDWRVGVGLVSAFAAREVFVSSLAVIFNVTEDTDEDSLRHSMIEKMNQATLENGAPLFTLSTVVGLIVYFMIALQCISTTAVAQREMQSWKFAIIQLISINIVAYALTAGVVHGLRAFGFS